MMTRIVTSRNRIVQAMRNFLFPLLIRIGPLRRKIKMTLSQLVYR